MFYAGATFVTKGHAFRSYDWKAATALLDRMLSSYDLSDEVASQTNPPNRAVA
jgi:4-hydroxyphenylacetate 3-monooxygenase